MSKTEYTIADLEAENLRLRRILAALENPSDTVVEAVFAAMLTMQCKTKDLIRAAAAAAKKEVDHA